MLYSHSFQERSLDYFASFIKNVINGDDRYVAVVLPILNDAKLLANEERDFFNITRNNYEVIVFLAQKDPQYFQQLNTNHLTPDDYQRIFDMVNTQREPLAMQ